MRIQLAELHVLDVHPAAVAHEDVVFGEDVADDVAVGYIVVLYLVVHANDVLDGL